MQAGKGMSRGSGTLAVRLVLCLRMTSRLFSQSTCGQVSSRTSPGRAEVYRRSGGPPPDFRVPPGSTQVLLLAPQTFSKMDREERIRACYQHCVLYWVCNKQMTNATLRQRFGIAEENYSMVSRVIRDTIDDGLIKKANPDSTSKRDAKYVPFWA